MALNYVNNESYEFEGSKQGTYTPNFTGQSGSHLEARQCGDMVFLTGNLAIDGTWGDVSGNNLGTLAGIDAPQRITQIPVFTYTDPNDLHPGYISVVDFLGSIQIAATVESTDSAMIINGCYRV